LKNIKKIKYWIFKIAVNLTINVLNKEKKLSLPGGDQLDLISDKQVLDDFQVGESKEDLDELHYFILELVERLPVKQRVVFSMKYVEGFKETEISDILDIPVGTVKSRLNIARNRIKELLCREFSGYCRQSGPSDH
jgi:RNA polymerase sigma-70 factor (ECF subfamily)